MVMMLAFSETNLAQESSKQTQVHLKDGSILVGEIIEDTDYYIRLVTSSLDTMEIGYKHILGLGNEFQTNRKYKVKPPFILKDSGFFANASVGATDQNQGESGGFRASLVVGKRMSNRLNLGIEIGQSNHIFSSSVAYAESSFLILGFNAKHFFAAKRHRWFVDGSMGYGISTGRENFFQQFHEYSGGVNSQVSIGRQWSLSNTMGLFFKAGVGYQHATGDIIQTWDSNPVAVSYRKEYLYPSFLIGIEF